MMVITQRDLILAVAKRWEEQYHDTFMEDKIEILKKLNSLDLKTVSAKEVESIIGNTSWTTRFCDECQEKVDWIIQLGAEPDYDSATADICKKCFKKAQRLVNADHP